MAGVIIHEWIEKTGGAERVLDAMAAVFPEADIRVLWNDDPSRFSERDVRENWIGRTPLRRNKALALPLMPMAWRDLPSQRSYEWMLVSSHLFAHHARFRGVNRAIPKLVYAHTPARYVWTPDLDQRGDSRVARTVSSLLKPLDRERSREAVAVAANSEFVRQRIQDSWGVDAQVVYPPVDTGRISSVRNWAGRVTAVEACVLGGVPDQFLLGASRFVRYKGLERVIEAGEAVGLPVVLAGSGPEERSLRERAAGSSTGVQFVLNPSDEMLFALYQRAIAFVFPAIEDFGIMPVEAMAAGTPVIACSIGGAAESVRAVAGGAHVATFEPEEWRRAVEEVTEIRRDDLAQRAHRFSSERFAEELTNWVRNSIEMQGVPAA